MANKKDNRIQTILIILGVLLLLYYMFRNSNPRGRGLPEEVCTNSCCNQNGNIVIPNNYPACKCPNSEYEIVNGVCTSTKVVQTDVVGCNDVLATNYNPMATIPCFNCCDYGQVSTPIIHAPTTASNNPQQNQS